MIKMKIVRILTSLKYFHYRSKIQQQAEVFICLTSLHSLFGSPDSPWSILRLLLFPNKGEIPRIFECEKNLVDWEKVCAVKCRYIHVCVPLAKNNNDE